jgi:phosphopantothenoylcysteine synthetase/decarboxylase
MTYLLTAGPTREALDPVRYLTNHSSGKMGYALAGTAAHDGHRVILISGPTALDVPAGVDFIPVTTAAEMFDAVSHWIGYAEVAIFTAAVADYRPAVFSPEKLKKTGEVLTLELVRTADILGSARAVFGFTGKLVGFAAETSRLEEHARKKLLEKSCDLVVGNDVSRRDIGFGADDNEVVLVTRAGTRHVARADKLTIAREILDAIDALPAELG